MQRISDENHYSSVKLSAVSLPLPNLTERTELMDISLGKLIIFHF